MSEQQCRAIRCTFPEMRYGRHHRRRRRHHRRSTLGHATETEVYMRRGRWDSFLLLFCISDLQRHTTGTSTSSLQLWFSCCRCVHTVLFSLLLILLLIFGVRFFFIYYNEQRRIFELPSAVVSQNVGTKNCRHRRKATDGKNGNIVICFFPLFFKIKY